VLCDQTLLVPARTSGGREGRSRACISTAAAFTYEDDPFEVVLMSACAAVRESQPDPHDTSSGGGNRALARLPDTASRVYELNIGRR